MQLNMTFKPNPLLAAITAFILLNMCTTARSEEPTEGAAPVSELGQMKLDAEMLRDITAAKLSAAKDEKALRELNYPVSETKGVDGKVTVGEGGGYVAELLVYAALEEAIDLMACDIRKSMGINPPAPDSKLKCSQYKNETTDMPHGATIAVSTSFGVIQQWSAHSAIEVRIDNNLTLLKGLESTYRVAGRAQLPDIDESAGALATALPAALGAISDVAAFFKVDRDIKSRAVNVSNGAITANLLRALNSDNKLISNAFNFGLTRKSQLLEKVKETAELQVQLGKTKIELRQNELVNDPSVIDLKKDIAELDRKIKTLEGVKSPTTTQKAELASHKDRLSKRSADLKAIEVSVEAAEDEIKRALDKSRELQASLVVPADSGVSVLETVLEYDLISSNSANPHLLFEVSSQGAEVEVSTGKLLPHRITYAGGLVVSYVLIGKKEDDGQRRVLTAGTIPVVKTAKYKSLEKKIHPSKQKAPQHHSKR